MIALIAIAGGIGAVTRFMLDGYVRAKTTTALPFGTIVINVTGSFVLALLAGLAANHIATQPLQQALGTGYLGGYTTFSTASVETVRLIQIRRLGAATVNSLGTLLIAFLAVMAGFEVANLF